MAWSYTAAGTSPQRVDPRRAHRPVRGPAPAGGTPHQAARPQHAGAAGRSRRLSQPAGGAIQQGRLARRPRCHCRPGHADRRQPAAGLPRPGVQVGRAGRPDPHQFRARSEAGTRAQAESRPDATRKSRESGTPAIAGASGRRPKPMGGWCGFCSAPRSAASKPPPSSMATFSMAHGSKPTTRPAVPTVSNCRAWHSTRSGKGQAQDLVFGGASGGKLVGFSKLKRAA